MRYKLLALDIDGTILNSHSELSDRTKGAILQAKQQGVNVLLATGRRLANTLALANSLDLTEFLVVHNGAVIYQFGPQVIRQQGIEQGVAQEIVDKLKGFALNYIVYTGESAGERVVAPLGRWTEPENLLSYYLGEDVEFLKELTLESSPVRISIIDEKQKVDPFYEELLRDHHGKMNALYFGSERDIWRGIEVIPADCHKGSGVFYVANRLGIRLEEVIAIGDNVNDLEMIDGVGLGIAMENGAKLLKEKARRIAPSNDADGVAAMIEEYLL